MKKDNILKDSIDNIDLTKDDYTFNTVAFPKLKKTDWDEFYTEQQKASVPVSLRLPKYFITKIKQQAVKTGIPYQMLIRMWLAEHLGLK